MIFDNLPADVVMAFWMFIPFLFFGMLAAISDLFLKIRRR